MKLDVKNLVLADVGAKEHLTVELFNEKEDEEVLAKRVKGTLNLTKLEEEILAQFSGEVRAKVICDRCLSEFETEVPLKFSQEYLIDKSPDEDIKLSVSRDFMIDVSEPIRQELLAALPVKKLCNEKCKGLCASCGANLNMEKCKCRKVKE